MLPSYFVNFTSNFGRNLMLQLKGSLDIFSQARRSRLFIISRVNFDGEEALKGKLYDGSEFGKVV